MANELIEAAHALRAFALSLPGAHEDFPWGERVVKVNGKVFVFLGRDEGLAERFGVAVKLPQSKEEALAIPGNEPTGYGLGKAGWVNASVPPGETPDVEQFRRWIEESYRAVAPKRMIKQLDAQRR
jgi:predicted DNA-binding protein (MmcQ/YjbR family)